MQLKMREMLTEIQRKPWKFTKNRELA